MTRKSYLRVALTLAGVVPALIWWQSAPRKARVSVATASSASPVNGLSASPGNPPLVTSQSVPVPAPEDLSAGNSLPAQRTATGVTIIHSEVPDATGGTHSLAARASNQEAMIDLDKTRHMITNYHTLMGENPVGTNAEIMKALTGGNPRQATLGPGEGQQLNSKGELVDRWGTPYFFHQLSGDQMEIHSAGPDKIMGTDDDLVLK